MIANTAPSAWLRAMASMELGYDEREPHQIPECEECGDTGWRERPYDGAPVQCVFCERMPALLRRQA